MMIEQTPDATGLFLIKPSINQVQTVEMSVLGNLKLLVAYSSVAHVASGVSFDSQGLAKASG